MRSMKLLLAFVVANPDAVTGLLMKAEEEKEKTEPKKPSCASCGKKEKKMCDESICTEGYKFHGENEVSVGSFMQIGDAKKTKCKELEAGDTDHCTKDNCCKKEEQAPGKEACADAKLGEGKDESCGKDEDFKGASKGGCAANQGDADCSKAKCCEKKACEDGSMKAADGSSYDKSCDGRTKYFVSTCSANDAKTGDACTEAKCCMASCSADGDISGASFTHQIDSENMCVQGDQIVDKDLDGCTKAGVDATTTATKIASCKADCCLNIKVSDADSLATLCTAKGKVVNDSPSDATAFKTTLNTGSDFTSCTDFKPTVEGDLGLIVDHCCKAKAS